MTRVKRGFVARRRRKKIMEKTFCTGINGGFRILKQKYMKAGISSYANRKIKKREFRRLWITRINAFLRSTLSLHKILTYSTFMYYLKNCNVLLNRKVLSQLACISPKDLYKIAFFCYVNV